MVNKVLIATDGSKQAEKAVALGSDIAAKHDAEVVLVHVLLRNEMSDDLRRMAEVEHLLDEDGQPVSDTLRRIPSGHLGAYLTLSDGSRVMPDRLLRAIGEGILSVAERSAREHGVKRVTKRVEDGKTVDRILHVAKAEGVDVVVSGARGLSDVSALVLGSVSHKLSHLASMTCVTVR